MSGQGSAEAGPESDAAAPGSVRTSLGRGVTRVEFHVADLDASIAFYRALGFRVARRWEVMARLELDGAELQLHGDAYLRDHEHYFTAYLDRAPRGVGVEVIVEVADVNAVHAAAVAAGLRIVKPLLDRPWRARDFRVADPDGYFLRITSPLA